MDAETIARKLNRIAVDLRNMDWWLDGKKLMSIIVELEDLSEDIQIDEAERLASTGNYRGPAFCIFCGERFIHGAHTCPRLLTYGQRAART